MVVLPRARRLSLWRESAGSTHLPKAEEMSVGHNLPYTSWRALNRLRTGVTRCYSNLKKWGYREDDICECGTVQDNSHLFSCPLIGVTCTHEDTVTAKDDGVRVADYWGPRI